MSTISNNSSFNAEIFDPTKDANPQEKSITLFGQKYRTVMVFGFDHCHYSAISKDLAQKVEKTYDFSVGGVDAVDDDGKPFISTRPDGTEIYKIRTKNNATDQKAACKDALVNIVMDNYEKIKSGDESITPIVFCIDTDEESRHQLTLPDLMSPHEDLNPLYTHKELRRAYKLCHDPSIDVSIREVAKKTFQFVRIRDAEFEYEKQGEKLTSYKLEHIPAPWENADFSETMQARHLAKQNPANFPKKPKKSPTSDKDDQQNWRQQIKLHPSIATLQNK